MMTKPCSLPGVLLITPRTFADPRGLFFESYQAERYAAVGVACGFVQDNVTSSRRDTLRGLHFQYPEPQAKLVQVLAGEIYDVVVDLRRGSPHFGRHFGLPLSAETHQQIFVPEGFAHGFVVTSDEALVSYKCSALYNAHHEHALSFNDPALGISWPVSAPILSERDRAAPRLAALQAGALMAYPGSGA